MLQLAVDPFEEAQAQGGVAVDAQQANGQFLAQHQRHEVTRVKPRGIAPGQPADLVVGAVKPPQEGDGVSGPMMRVVAELRDHYRQGEPGGARELGWPIGQPRVSPPRPLSDRGGELFHRHALERCENEQVKSFLRRGPVRF